MGREIESCQGIRGSYYIIRKGIVGVHFFGAMFASKLDRNLAASVLFPAQDRFCSSLSFRLILTDRSLFAHGYNPAAGSRNK
jgi:hypothetical protein